MDLLDTEPKKAWEQFYREAIGLLSVCPPLVARSLSRDDLNDCLAFTMYHCYKDNYRVLRQYRDVGKPFKAWLYLVARNKTIDWLREQQHQHLKAVAFDPVVHEPQIDDSFTRVSKAPDKVIEDKELKEAIRRAISRLSLKCQVLLEMWVDGFTPQEMVLELRLEKDQNKKVSDNLKYCKKMLKKTMTRPEGGTC